MLTLDDAKPEAEAPGVTDSRGSVSPPVELKARQAILKVEATVASVAVKPEPPNATFSSSKDSAKDRPKAADADFEGPVKSRASGRGPQVAVRRVSSVACCTPGTSKSGFTDAFPAIYAVARRSVGSSGGDGRSERSAQRGAGQVGQHAHRRVRRRFPGDEPCRGRGRRCSQASSSPFIALAGSSIRMLVRAAGRGRRKPYHRPLPPAGMPVGLALAGRPRARAQQRWVLALRTLGQPCSPTTEPR